jgi:uncharacterized membrane protein YccC
VRPTPRRSRRLSLRAAALLVSATGALALAGCSAGGDRAAGFCKDVGQVPVINSADQLQGTGGQATLADLRSALDDLHGRAPDQVADDVATLSRVTGQLQAALREQDAGDQAAADRVRGDLDASLSTFEAASARVVAYSRQTCGLDLGGAASSTTAAPRNDTPTGAGTDDTGGDGATTTTAAP